MQAIDIQWEGKRQQTVESLPAMDGAAEFACRYGAVGLVSGGAAFDAVGHACRGGRERIRAGGAERHAESETGHPTDGHHVHCFSKRSIERRFRVVWIRCRRVKMTGHIE